MSARFLILIIGLLVSPLIFAQKGNSPIDLGKALEAKKIKVVNRNASTLTDGKYRGIRMDAKDNDGVAWLEGIAFNGGTIECDIRGKDVFQKSFLGLAFFGQNEQTYEGIYFRPFNFKAQDSLRRMHAVQYIFHPDYPWNKLRSDYPEVYENPVQPAPDPNGWFHVRIVVDSPEITVFVNDASAPSLVVKQLSNNTSGKVGLWVGHQSEGEFANLTVRPAKKR